MNIPHAEPFGRLVVHLCIVAARDGWMPDRLDAELVRGLRRLAARLELRPSGELARRQTNFKHALPLP